MPVMQYRLRGSDLERFIETYPVAQPEEIGGSDEG